MQPTINTLHTSEVSLRTPLSNEVKNSRTSRLEEFDDFLSTFTTLHDQIHDRIQETMDTLREEKKERIATLAFEKEFDASSSIDLKSLFAGTPSRLEKKTLIGLADKISHSMAQHMTLRFTNEERADIMSHDTYKELLISYAKKYPKSEPTLGHVLRYGIEKYFKDFILKNLSTNLPLLEKKLDFNMFFNDSEVLSLEKLRIDVPKIQEELIENFLQEITTAAPSDIIPLEAHIQEKLKAKTLITSSGLNRYIQGQANLRPKDRKYYIQTFSQLADTALLTLIKREQTFHHIQNDKNFQDKQILADLRSAKKEAEKILRGIGHYLKELSLEYTPELSTAHLSTDFDSSLESLNLFELISLLIHSKTLTESQSYEVQQLAFFTHMVYAIMSDPHYKNMKEDNSFHIDRVAAQGDKYYIKQYDDQTYYIDTSSEGAAQSVLVERQWVPEGEDPKHAVRFFYIGNREKSILSIIIKFFAKEKVQHIEDLYDLWGATFVLNHTKEEVQKDLKLQENIKKFALSIGRDNFYTELSEDTDDKGKPKNPTAGFFTIETDKVDNPNSSSLFEPAMKVTAKTEEGVGKEAIIHYIDSYLKSLDPNSPANHKSYEDTRFLPFAAYVTPAILFMERYDHILKIYEALSYRRKLAEHELQGKLISKN